MKRLILFSNPFLERRFRRLVECTEEEIGGSFIVTCEPNLWPERFSWRAFKRDLLPKSCASAWFIDAVIMMPNQSARPEFEWTLWDFEKARELADDTATLMGGTPIDFHTHPTGSAEPSGPDLSYAAAWCQLWKGCAAFVIVTARPLRLHYYEMEIRAAATPDRAVSIQRGEFISWRSPRLRDVTKG